MRKRALFKSSLREMKQSPARFFSILGIIFLGVAFFVGIGATGPDMLQSADAYYKKYKLADVTLISSLGFSEKDQEYLQKNERIKTLAGQYMIDLQLPEKDEVVRLYSLGENRLNQPKIVSGRLPKNKNEIALDVLAKEHYHYQMGDTFELKETDSRLAAQQFKIVGFVSSPELIDNSKRGNTNVGNGSVDYFAFLTETAFELDAYVRLLVSFKDLQTVSAYSEEYDQRFADDQAQLEEWLEPRKTGRLQEIKDELAAGRKEITAGKEKIEKAEKELQQAAEKLAAGRWDLDIARADYEAQTANAEAELQAREAQLEQSENELLTQEQALTERQQALDQLARDLPNLEKKLPTLQKQQTEQQQALRQLQAAERGYQGIIDTLDGVDEERLSDAETDALLAEIQREVQAVVANLPDSADLSAVTEPIDTEGLLALGVAIDEQLSPAEKKLQELDTQITEITGGTQRLETERQQLVAASDQIASSRNQLTLDRQQLDAAKQALASENASAVEKLTTAEKELTASEKKYQAGQADFDKQKKTEWPKLLAAEKKLAAEQKRVAELQPASFTFFERNSQPGYAEYQENAERISSIATVFPTIFFLIAALVSLTTMGRMIEEKRGEIGTLKALGYKNGEIARKFLLYSLSAGLLGSLLGLAVGFYLFPTIIISAYGQLYSIKDFLTPWYLSYSLIGVAVALICTAGVAMIVLRVDLFSSPATLLRPKAPKAGKRIWLEYLRPVWKSLSFIQKVTMRNLFRYKARMLMTIFGIAGCTAMILTGFGLRDSISDIVPIQFSKIWHYQSIVSFDEDRTEADYAAYLERVSAWENLAVHVETLTVEQSGTTEQELTIYVPETPAKLADFVLFNDRRSGERYELTDEGAVINEKLADLGNFAVGDTLTLKNADHETFKIKISAIVENYVGHFAYVSPTYFEQVFDQEPAFNTDLLLFNEELSQEDEAMIAERLLELDSVRNVSFLSDSSTTLDETTGTLNIVVWVLIISAGLLALIVLYNLNNINISERIRELSTIKVLGFYDNELTMYIYRENILLTIIGVATGLALGLVLHGYVLQTVELDMIMFSPAVHVTSYLYAALITIFFTIVVGLVMYWKLKKVDMIEALKSNE